MNRLCDDDVVAAAEAFLAPVLEKPLEAVIELKRLARLSEELPLDTGLDREGAVLQALFESPDGKARVREFVTRHTKE